MSEIRYLRENSQTGEILNVTDRLIIPVIKHESEELVKKKLFATREKNIPATLN